MTTSPSVNDRAVELIEAIDKESKGDAKLFRAGDNRLRLAGNISDDLFKRIQAAKDDILKILANSPEIFAMGSIHLGWERKLDESSETVSAEPPNRAVYVSSGPLEQRPVEKSIGGPEGDPARRKILHRLVGTKPPQIVEITDKGLVTSYGIKWTPWSRQK